MLSSLSLMPATSTTGPGQPFSPPKPGILPAALVPCLLLLPSAHEPSTLSLCPMLTPSPDRSAASKESWREGWPPVPLVEYDCDRL